MSGTATFEQHDGRRQWRRLEPGRRHPQRRRDPHADQRHLWQTTSEARSRPTRARPRPVSRTRSSPTASPTGTATASRRTSPTTMERPPPRSRRTSAGNLDQDNSCGLTVGHGDKPGVDPRLASIADNTGPTRTEALVFGSPALGGANGQFCPLTDQRGHDRANPCDIGAFEADITGQEPSATTDAARNVGQDQADLVADVNFGGEAGGVHFLWGTSPDCLGPIRPARPARASSPRIRQVAQTLPSLSPGTTYYFQAVADNASGTATGGLLSFTTAAGAAGHRRRERRTRHRHDRHDPLHDQPTGLSHNLRRESMAPTLATGVRPRPPMLARPPAPSGRA